MAAPEPLDLFHLGRERVIGVYVLETADGPALFDCGPATCIDALKEALSERGLRLTDLRHLLVSHIHLDHAGAAGVLVRDHPALQIHVSPAGAPHLIDPERLERSARRLYGDEFERLWGELAPVPAGNVHETGASVLGLECFPSPGHASHHVCYLGDDGTLYAGDATGVRIQPHSLVLPPTPPPEFDLDAWLRTLDDIERHAPERLALIHFGVAEDVERHLRELRKRLTEWADLVENGVDEGQFIAAAGDLPVGYEQAMPLLQSYAGLKRYWEKAKAA